jgi:hypothetical protein
MAPSAKYQDEIIKELLARYRVPDEVIAEAERGLKHANNCKFFWQRNRPTAGTSHSDHPWFDVDHEVLHTRRYFIASYVTNLLTWILLILALTYISEQYSVTRSGDVSEFVPIDGK